MKEVTDIHRPFVSWLQKNWPCYVYHRPDKRSGIMEGWPDFTLVSGVGNLLIECKIPGGKQSPKQDEVRALLAQHGMTVHLAYSLEECVALASNWLANGGVYVHPAQQMPDPGKAREERVKYGRKVIVLKDGVFDRFETV